MSIRTLVLALAGFRDGGRILLALVDLRDGGRILHDDRPEQIAAAVSSWLADVLA